MKAISWFILAFTLTIGVPVMAHKGAEVEQINNMNCENSRWYCCYMGICTSRQKQQLADFRWACKFRKSRYGCPPASARFAV